MPAGLAADNAGNFYCISGNGTLDTTLTPAGFPINGDYGDSFLKVGNDAVHNSPTNQNKNGWGLQVVDYFAPFNNHALDGADTDLGSGGPIVLPDSAGSVAHPHLLVGSGKEGKLYMLDRDGTDPTWGMGRFDPNTGAWTIYSWPTKGMAQRQNHMLEREGVLQFVSASGPAHRVGRMVMRSERDVQALRDRVR